MTPQVLQIPLDTQIFAALGGPNLVYVRTVSSDEIIDTASAEVVETFGLQPHQILYAVHRADGARLAVLADRASAFAAALSHDLAPVSVH